jgi:cell division protein FtsZ
MALGTSGKLTGEQSAGSTALSRIAVVGVGGGGCNAVRSMAADWDNGPTVMAINTDAQSLDGIGVERRLQIGEKITRGMGTGGDSKVGRLAAEDDIQSIRSLVAGMDLVFIVTALGGGTGTGAAPVVARAAHDSGALVIAFATLPFSFEGERRMSQARQGLAELRDQADVVVAVSNQSLFSASVQGAAAETAFKQADYVLSMGVFAIWKLLMHRGLVNVDFATLRMVARHSGGVTVFSYGEGRGATKAEDAVRAALNSPLIENGQSLTEAQSVLVSVLGGPDMTMQEIEGVMTSIQEVLRKDAHVFMGAAIDPHWTDTISVTIVASQYWAADTPERDEPESDGGSARPAAAEKRKRRGKATQPTLGLDSIGKGMFKDVEPTIIDGEDMDIPTFIRRGVQIEK